MGGSMKALSTRRTLTAVTAATLIGLTVAACQTTGHSAAAPPTTSTTPTTTAAENRVSAPPAAARPAGASTAVNAAPTRKLKFPNTSADVVFTRYDSKNKLVAFQKVVQDPTSRAAHLVPDPSDPATHELPMAHGTNVKSIDPNGFPFETCPPVACTVDDVMESVILHNNGAFWAHIHVNAEDQIDFVAQSAY